MLKSGSKDPERSAAMKGNRNAAGPRSGSARPRIGGKSSSKFTLPRLSKNQKLAFSTGMTLGSGVYEGAKLNEKQKANASKIAAAGTAFDYAMMTKPGRRAKGAIIGAAAGYGLSKAGQAIGGRINKSKKP